jgi:hypothetical protein
MELKGRQSSFGRSSATTGTMIRRLAVQHQARVVLNDEARQLVW